jgi:hypothetical protein
MARTRQQIEADQTTEQGSRHHINHPEFRRTQCNLSSCMLLNSNEKDDSRATSRRRDSVSRSSEHGPHAVVVIREDELHGRVIDRRSWLAGGRLAVRGKELPGQWVIIDR